MWQNRIVFEKPSILSENFKTLASFYSSIFFAETSHVSMSKKGCAGYFYFVYLLKLKGPGFYTLIFNIFINDCRSRQSKKNPKHIFVDIIK